MKAYCYQYGDAVIATGELRQPNNQRNLDGFNHREYLMTQGIFGTIHGIEEIKRTSHGNGILPLIWAESVQCRIQRILALSEHSNVLRAMCLIFLGAHALDKKLDLPDVLLIVAFAILLYNPLNL